MTAAFTRIDIEHAKDPTKIDINGFQVPYELHYAQQCTYWLEKRWPDPSEELRLAVRALHLRRWEVPRHDFPMTRQGYHEWRTLQRTRSADLLGRILEEVYSETLSDWEWGYFSHKVTYLMQKGGFQDGRLDATLLEDVACLVFFQEQLTELLDKHNDDKVVGIVRKIWAKMSRKGRDMALDIPLDERAMGVFRRALERDGNIVI